MSKTSLPTDTVSLVQFLDVARPGLARAFRSMYGREVGAEVLADVEAWAVEHQGRLLTMTNPVGYLFRVGQSSARKYQRYSRSFAESLNADLTSFCVSWVILRFISARRFCWSTGTAGVSRTPLPT